MQSEIRQQLFWKILEFRFRVITMTDGPWYCKLSNCVNLGLFYVVMSNFMSRCEQRHNTNFQVSGGGKLRLEGRDSRAPTLCMKSWLGMLWRTFMCIPFCITVLYPPKNMPSPFSAVDIVSFTDPTQKGGKGLRTSKHILGFALSAVLFSGKPIRSQLWHSHMILDCRNVSAPLLHLQVWIAHARYWPIISEV